MAYADQLEAAQEYEQRFNEAALEAARAACPPPLAPVGACHNCDEPLEQGRAFCDADCRDDYDARKRSREACRS